VPLDIPGVLLVELELVVGLVDVPLFAPVLDVVEDELPELVVEFVLCVVPDPPGPVLVVPLADVPEGDVVEPVDDGALLVPGIGSHPAVTLGVADCEPGVAVLAGGVAVCGVGDAVWPDGVPVCGVGDAVWPDGVAVCGVGEAVCDGDELVCDPDVEVWP
jgi:hypothetical protein